METTDPELRGLQTFVVQLGAAMNAAGVPVDSVQQRLARVAGAYGARKARITAFPTYLMVTMGRGELATLELTTVSAHRPGSIRSRPSIASSMMPSGVSSPRPDGLRRLRENPRLAPPLRHHPEHRRVCGVLTGNLPDPASGCARRRGRGVLRCARRMATLSSVEANQPCRC